MKCIICKSENDIRVISVMCKESSINEIIICSVCASAIVEHDKAINTPWRPSVNMDLTSEEVSQEYVEDKIRKQMETTLGLDAGAGHGFGATAVFNIKMHEKHRLLDREAIMKLIRGNEDE